MRNKIKFEIKNKKLFDISIKISLLIAIVNFFLEIFGWLDVNEFLVVLIKDILILSLLTMIYLSLEHNKIIGVFYGMSVCVSVFMIIICCVNLIKVL